MLRRLVRRLGATPVVTRFAPLLVPADRVVGRLTGGRVVALGLVPSLMITTIGRRSGEPRHNPLLYVPDRDAFVVVGSNWGKTAHPAWALNLLADPRATVTVGGRRIAVRARLVRGPERERLWGMLTRAWPAYRAYVDRSGGRDLRIFRLEPAA
jgi:deazaflavin-dependent oxidoreductase (nitroreductase family)